MGWWHLLRRGLEDESPQVQPKCSLINIDNTWGTCIYRDRNSTTSSIAPTPFYTCFLPISTIFGVCSFKLSVEQGILLAECSISTEDLTTTSSVCKRIVLIQLYQRHCATSRTEHILQNMEMMPYCSYMEYITSISVKNFSRYVYILHYTYSTTHVNNIEMSCSGMSVPFSIISHEPQCAPNGTEVTHFVGYSNKQWWYTASS